MNSIHNKIIVFSRLSSVDECEGAINSIRTGYPILVYFGNTETHIANSIYTILSGAVYALDGGKHKVDEDTYIFYPKRVEIVT